MSKPFFGGMPTEPDVKALQEAFPDVAKGETITHDAIEGVIRYSRQSGRYRIVVKAWRKHLLTTQNVDLGAIHGIGFRALNAEERINESIRGVRSGVRKTMRSVSRASYARTDDPVLVSKQDLLRRYGAAMSAQAANTFKQLDPPPAPQALPRIVPPAKVSG